MLLFLRCGSENFFTIQTRTHRVGTEHIFEWERMCRGHDPFKIEVAKGRGMF